MDWKDVYKSQTCMPPTHPEMSHSDRHVELIILNRALFNNYSTILIIQSGIIIVHIGSIGVLFIFITVGFVVISVDARVHIVIVDWHKGVVVFTQNSVFCTPYCIKI